MATGNAVRLVGGRYRVDRELDRGPGTLSLLVTDLRNGRPCVLRQLSAAAAPAVARRFAAQAAILAKLDHPGLPRFIDGFSEGEGDAAQRSVVTSYHPGESLERLVVKGRPLTEAQALVLLRRLVPVLVYLHGFDPPLTHRTIDASGIIIGPDGRPCLTDLDYAVAGEVAEAAEQAPPGFDEPPPAAPEVFAGGAVPASDIYALGLAVCRGMTARDPALLLREGARLQLRGALGVSEAFAALIARMLEPSLERRYPDAKALEADLARLAGVRIPPAQVAPVQQSRERAAEEPGPRRPLRPLVVAGVVVIVIGLLGLGAVVVRRRNQPAPPTSLLVATAPPEPAAAPPTQAEPAPAALTPAAPGSTSPAPPAPETSPGTPAPPAAAATQAAEPAPAPPGPPAATPVPVAGAAVATTPQADPASLVVEGRLLFDGKPFVSPAAAPPQFWFRKAGTKTEIKPRVDYAAGAFAIHGLSPGRYAMSVRVNLEPRNPNIFPGDLSAWLDFTIEAGRPVALEVPLRTIIHLVQPVDNGVVIHGWDTPCGAGNASPGKVVFSWESLGPGTSYAASVDRLNCGRNFAVGRVFTGSTADTYVNLDLPPNKEGECYSFRLTASRGGQTVGILSTHGKTGLGWDYRFSVAGR